MIRLLVFLLLSTASATPPPQPSGARIEGFHRVWVTPDAFADGLTPRGARPVVPLPEPPRSEPVVFLVLEPQATKDAGHTAATLADHLRTVEHVTDVEVNADGTALKIVLAEPRDLNPVPVPTHHDAPVPLGSLGKLEGLPQIRPQLPGGGGPARPRALPEVPKGNHLMLTNPTGVKVVVKVNNVEVGELKPYATAVIHDVRPGTYDVVYVGPTGFERAASPETVATPASPAE